MRVSVLIPCFNAASYLGEALASVLAQTLAPFEVIVVDDGSTDESAAIAERGGARVERQPHRGIAATRNQALAMAQGDTIAFLDADDLWPADSLARRARALSLDPSLGGAGGLVEEFLSPELDEAARSGLICQPAPIEGRLMGALLVRREVFTRIGTFDASYEVGESLDWVARVTAHPIAMPGLPDVVLRRRVHLDNTGARLRDRRGDYLRLLRASLDRRRRAPTTRAE